MDIVKLTDLVGALAGAKDNLDEALARMNDLDENGTDLERYQFVRDLPTLANMRDALSDVERRYRNKLDTEYRKRRRKPR